MVFLNKLSVTLEIWTVGVFGNSFWKIDWLTAFSDREGWKDAALPFYTAASFGMHARHTP